MFVPRNAVNIKPKKIKMCEEAPVYVVCDPMPDISPFETQTPVAAY